MFAFLAGNGKKTFLFNDELAANFSGVYYYYLEIGTQN
jgi:hypothetical protein